MKATTDPATKKDLGELKLGLKKDLNDTKQELKSVFRKDLDETKQELKAGFKKDLDDTKTVLRKEITETKMDLTIEIIKTRDELDKKIDTVEGRMLGRMDNVMNLVDSVLGEVKAMREEQAAHYLDHDRIDQRFKIIESVPMITQALR